MAHDYEAAHRCSECTGDTSFFRIIDYYFHVALIINNSMARYYNEASHPELLAGQGGAQSNEGVE